VGTYIVNNGELKSDEFVKWCRRHGIAIIWTPPHISKKNGKVECFHHTVHRKARAMCIECGAPPDLWDEFCVTATYLHTRTPSRALGGKTPHEGFEKVKPHLGHLREIGCCAFILIEAHNPKVFARSIKCVLIGYTPNCKAYQCWQRLTGKIFNSGNICFIESGQTEEVSYDREQLAERLAHPSVTTDAAAASVPDDQSSPDLTMSTSTLPTVNDPVEFTDPPMTTTQTQALPVPQAIPSVGAIPAQQAIPRAVPSPPPPLR
jgi:hypothetical protein